MQDSGRVRLNFFSRRAELAPLEDAAHAGRVLAHHERGGRFHFAKVGFETGAFGVESRVLGEGFQVEVRDGLCLRGSALSGGNFQRARHFRRQGRATEAAGQCGQAHAAEGPPAAVVLLQLEAQHGAAGEADGRGGFQQGPV